MFGSWLSSHTYSSKVFFLTMPLLLRHIPEYEPMIIFKLYIQNVDRMLPKNEQLPKPERLNPQISSQDSAERFRLLKN